MTHSEKEKKNTNGRIFGLDILRACAILFVMIGHGNDLLPKKYANIIESVFSYDGVSIFFVLSGFLIGGILIKTIEKKRGEKNVLLNFWIRRWFRTIPNYFFVLIILLILNLLFTNGFSLDKKFPLNFFTFTQNLFCEHPNFYPEAWSLSVEEWFYLIVPLIIFLFIFFKKNSKASFLYTAISILLVITLFRFYRYSNISIDNFAVSEWDNGFRKQVITRLDSLMYGMIGAFFQYHYKEYWLKYKKMLFCFGLFLFVAAKYLIDSNVSFIGMGRLYFCVFYFSIISVATLLLLPFLSDFRRDTGFIQKCITKISLISYSMYLINLSIVQYWIINIIPWNIIIPHQYIKIGVTYLLFWILTIFLSMIIYKYFEVPIMNLRDNKIVKRWLRI